MPMLLFLVLYYLYALYNFTIYPETNFSANSSIEELCEIALTETEKFAQLKKYEFKVGSIRYWNYTNTDVEKVKIVLVTDTHIERQPYKLQIYFDLKENKIKEIMGCSIGDHIDGTISMDYSNWNISSKDAIRIYKNYLSKTEKDGTYIESIDGYYDYDLNTPVWRVWGALNLLIDPYTGEILTIIQYD